MAPILEDVLGLLTQPAAALRRLDAALPAIRALRDPLSYHMAGNTLRAAAQFERALPLLQESLNYVERGNARHEETGRSALDDIKACKRLLRAQGPWWRFWA